MLSKADNRSSRWRVSFVQALLVAALASCAHADHGPSQFVQRPVELDDVLATEFIGRAEFSPDGQWLAYSVTPPYSQLSDYSYWMRAGGLSGDRIWVKDLRSDGAGQLQPGLELKATNFLFGWSPDSRWIVALEYLKGRLRIVACRVGLDDCVRFEQLPDIRDRYAAAWQWNERLAWVSKDRFVMPVRDPDLPGSEMRNRALTGTLLANDWHTAWDGTGVTVSEVVSTGRDRSTDWSSGDLVLFDLGARSWQVLAKGRFAGPLPSPDGTKLIAAQVAERARPSAHGAQGLNSTHPIFDRRYRLTLLELDAHDLDWPDGPFSVDPGSFVWSADSESFAVYGWRQDEAPEAGRFYVYASDGQLKQEVNQDKLRFSRGVAVQDPDWWTGAAPPALLSHGLAVHGAYRDDGQLGWFLVEPDGTLSSLSPSVSMPEPALIAVQADTLAVLSGRTVYRLAPGRAPERLSLAGAATFRRAGYVPYPSHALSGESYPAARVAPSRPGDTSLVIAEDAAGHDLGALSALEHSGSIALPENLPSGARILAVSDAARAILATRRVGAATRLELFRSGKEPETLAAINGHLDEILPPATRKVVYSLTGGGSEEPRSIETCLLLPPGFDPARRHPLVLEVYPTGTGGDCRTLTDAPGVAPFTGDTWAARGFIYARPAFPLDLAAREDDPLGRLGVLLDQTIEALAVEGYIDEDRVVLFGFSQGGAASLVAASQSRVPAAIISVNGWANYFSHYFGARGLMRYFHLDQNGGDNRWRYECTGTGPINSCPFGFGRTALTDPESFARASPVSRAADFSAPVLLVHSDFDYFDMAQYDEMFGALYRAGKDARYLRYWGEGHGPSSPANIRDLWTRIDAFLEEAGVRAAE
jgi:dipeptidyl aminopeptidase/acylaminoacyl peptidase